MFGGGTLTIRFFSWKGGKDSLKEFMNEVNSFHPTMKFTAGWLKK